MGTCFTADCLGGSDLEWVEVSGYVCIQHRSSLTTDKTVFTVMHELADVERVSAQHVT